MGALPMTQSAPWMFPPGDGDGGRGPGAAQRGPRHPVQVAPHRQAAADRGDPGYHHGAVADHGPAGPEAVDGRLDGAGADPGRRGEGLVGGGVDHSGDHVSGAGCPPGEVDTREARMAYDSTSMGWARGSVELTAAWLRAPVPPDGVDRAHFQARQAIRALSLAGDGRRGSRDQRARRAGQQADSTGGARRLDDDGHGGPWPWWPRGVTIRSPIHRVVEEPTTTTDRMDTSPGSRRPRVLRTTPSAGPPPTSVTTAAGVAGARWAARMARASSQLGGPPRRSRVVEGHDEVALGEGAEATSDHVPRGEQVRQRHGRMVVPQGRPQDGRRAQRGGHARHDRDRRVTQVGRQFQDQRRHGVHAGVAGAHQGHVVAAGGPGQGLAASVGLGANG